MANDNSQNSKDSKKIFSTIVEPISSFFSNPIRPISPAPSEASQRRSSSWKGKFRSRVSKNPSGKSQLNPGTVTPREAHRTPPVLFEQPASSLVVQDQPESSAQPAPPAVTSTSQNHGIPGNPTETTDESRAAPKTGSTTVENLKLTGRFLQTVITKAAVIVDTNPAKVALGLAQAIIEAKNVVEDNKDSIRRRIESVGAQLQTVANTLAGWQPSDAGERQWMEQFTTTLGRELKELIKLSNESTFRKIMDHQDEQGRIAVIFEHVNEARVQFELAMGLRVFKSVYRIEERLRSVDQRSGETRHAAKRVD